MVASFSRRDLLLLVSPSLNRLFANSTSGWRRSSLISCIGCTSRAFYLAGLCRSMSVQSCTSER